MKTNFLLILITFSCLAAHAQQQKPKSAKCIQAAARARKDIVAGKEKYYSFGIVGPSKAFVDKMKKYNIHVVSRGCTVDDNELCYNNIIDSCLRAKTGKTVSSL